MDGPDQPEPEGPEEEWPEESPRPRQVRAYFWLMGTCLVLLVLAWNVVRFWSIPVAVGMSIVAAVIPPVAAIVGNWGALRSSAPPDFHRSDPDR